MIMRVIAISLLCVTNVAAGPAAWVSAPIFDMEPLELKLGTFTEAPGANLLVMALTNDGTNNNLYAIDVPAPYDGTGVTSAMLDSSDSLFGVGDMCLIDGIVIVPYIEDFDVVVGRYNGAWSNFRIPDSTANSITTADCVVTRDGMFISGQNFDNETIEVFQSTDHGLSFDWYGTIGSGDIRGPFNGAVKDQLISYGRATSDVMSYHQRTDGQMQATHFRTDQPSPGVFTSQAFLPLSVPLTFSVLRESAASLGFSGISLTFNGDDDTIVSHFPFATPLVPDTWVVGQTNSNGTQYPFQGAAIVPFPEGRNHAVQSNYYRLGDEPNPVMENNYPNANVGGPIDGCRIDHHPSGYDTVAGYVLPRVGSSGIDLVTFTDLSDQIFAGKFETLIRTYYCF